jgi:hypothetical protein
MPLPWRARWLCWRDQEQPAEFSVSAPLSISETSIAERLTIGERVLVAFTVYAGFVHGSTTMQDTLDD